MYDFNLGTNLSKATMDILYKSFGGPMSLFILGQRSGRIDGS